VTLAGKIFVAILLVALLLFAGHVAYAYLLPRWVPLLFYAYAILGLVFWTIGIAGVISERRNPKAFKDETVDVLEEATKKSGLLAWLARLRDKAALLAAMIGNPILWPVGAISGFRLARSHPGGRMGLREIGLRQALTLSEHYNSLFCLAVVAPVLILESRHVALGKYGSIALSLIVVNTISRHVRYAIATTPLAAGLRRISATPYLMFLIIMATDFSVLVLALAALSKPIGTSPLTPDDVRHTANQLLQAQEPLSFFAVGRSRRSNWSSGLPA
jgi:hypothetical protein